MDVIKSLDMQCAIFGVFLYPKYNHTAIAIGEGRI